jgi:hypothetical protein
MTTKTKQETGYNPYTTAIKVKWIINQEEHFLIIIKDKEGIFQAL